MLKFSIMFTAIFIAACENQNSDTAVTLEYAEAQVGTSSVEGDVGFEGLWFLSMGVVEGATQVIPDRFIEITPDGETFILRCSTDGEYYRSEKYRGTLSGGRIIFENDKKLKFGLQGQVSLIGGSLEVFDDILGFEYVRITSPPEVCDLDSVTISEIAATSVKGRNGLDMSYAVEYNLKSKEKAKIYLGYSQSSGEEYTLIDTKVFIDEVGRGSRSFSVQDIPVDPLLLQTTNFYIFLMSYFEENDYVIELAYDYIKLQEK